MARSLRLVTSAKAGEAGFPLNEAMDDRGSSVLFVERDNSVFFCEIHVPAVTPAKAGEAGCG